MSNEILTILTLLIIRFQYYFSSLLYMCGFSSTLNAAKLQHLRLNISNYYLTLKIDPCSHDPMPNIIFFFEE